MKVAGRVCVLPLVWGLVACGATQAEAPPPVAPSAARNAVPAPPPPLAEVAAPADLFFVGRFSEPAATLDRVAGWANLPLPWQEWVVERAGSLGKHLDFSAPLDVAVTIDPDAHGNPKVLGTVSLGLRAHKEVLEALRADGNAVEHVSADLDYFSLDGELSCAVARANGVAPARLVCGNERRALDVLAGYSATNLSVQKLSDKAVFLKFMAEPLRKRYGKRASLIKAGVPVLLREASLGNARFDAALADAAYAVADEAVGWVDQLDTFTLSSAFAKDKEELESEATLAFRKAGGYVTDGLVRAAAEQGPAPELFWSLPSDVTGAGFGVKRTVTPADRKIIDTLAELMGGGLEYLGIAGGPLNKWLDDFRALGVASPIVVGRGSAGELKGRSVEETVAIQAMGYHVIGVEGDEGGLARLLETSVAVFNDKKLRAELDKRGLAKIADIPALRVRKAQKRPNLAVPVTLYDLAITVPADKTDSKTALKTTATLAVATSGTRTWFSVALNEGLALDKLKQVLSPVEATSLAGRTELASLRQTRVLSSYFFTVDGIFNSFAAALSATGKGSYEDLQRAMPNHGKSVLFFDVAASATGPSTTVRFSVPRGAVEDAVAAGLSLATLVGSH